MYESAAVYFLLYRVTSTPAFNHLELQSLYEVNEKESSGIPGFNIFGENEG